MALAGATAYIALMVLAAGSGERRVRAFATAVGLEPLDILVSPAAANPFAAEVEVVTATGYVPGELRWLRRPDVRLRPADSVPFLALPADADPLAAASALEASRGLPDVRDYLTWSRYPHADVRREGDAWVVRWSDARYDDGDGAGGLSGVTVRVSAGL